MQSLIQINRYFYLTFFLFVIGIIGISAQNDIPPKPSLETSVYDEAGLLTTAQFKVLENKLIKYNDTTSTQIVVAIVNTIHGKNIALYATEWAHEWGIGQEGKDNGVFILIAKDDRKLTIRTGYGVEHLLTDAYSRRIIEQVIKPEFKVGRYYKGIDKGTTYVMRTLNGEFKGTPQHNAKSNNEGIPIVFIVFLVFILIIILSNRNKGNGGRGYRRDSTGSVFETIILSNEGRGGFGGGGFGGSSGGGGGFGSGGFGGGFGGGGFGGGGASGSW